ncbi:MAG TPA: plastocyanin/azurin family copper-binding protein [Acidimicrobiales bacterium]
MARRFALVLAGVVLGAGGLVACGDDDGGGDGTTNADNAETEDTADGGGEEVPEDVVVLDTDPSAITALDNTFRPENAQVPAGTEVVWTNRGRTEHNVLSVEGEDWGVEVEDFQPGASYSHTFEEPGVYRYYCSLHGTEDAGMIGTLVVTEPGTDPDADGGAQPGADQGTDQGEGAG